MYLSLKCIAAALALMFLTFYVSNSIAQCAACRTVGQKSNFYAKDLKIENVIHFPKEGVKIHKI